jgi:UPF0716 protein FxsA
MPLLVLLFVVVPFVELYLIIQVGQAIGAVPTIALLLADSLLGSWLLRSQGRAVWQRFRTALASGRPPARETIDGALVIFGGALMLAPGFVTDAFGALLLLPPSRAAVRRAILRHARSRLFLGFGGVGGRGAPRGRTREDEPVDAIAREIDPPTTPR